MKAAFAFTIALLLTPAAHAQDAPAAAEAKPMPAMDHAQAGHGSTNMDGDKPADHGSMSMPADNKPAAGSMKMDKNMKMGAGDAAIPQSPPPPAAFEGPLHAADAAVGKAVMDNARAKVVREISGLPVFWVMGDRLEYRAHNGKDGYVWDVQAAYGGHIDKLWLRGEGEGTFDGKVESADLQALWSHAIGPWFDLQTGVRQSLVGPERTYAVAGVQGLAPYMFDVNAAAYLSQKGEVTARVEAELDQRITQRLILQPRGEVKLSAQDVPELGIGAGIDRIETGLRLRYEIAREFAPYVGVAQEWKVGRSATFARAAGDKASSTNFVAGVRFWF